MSKENQELINYDVIDKLNVLLSKKLDKQDVYVHYDDIKPYTKTFIINMDITLNIEGIFEFLPITDYKVLPRKRGRKKKNEKVEIQNDIKEGSIITLKYKGKTRGVDLKKDKKEENKKFFRNSVTIVIFFSGKKINFKISKNGKIQMTGCQNIDHAILTIKYLWSYIEPNKDLYELKDQKKVDIVFIPAMRNIHFDLGFNIDREKLDQYINNHTNYKSLFETSVGYTGVNIKMPVGTIINSHIDKLYISNITYNIDEKDWTTNDNYTYSIYIESLPEKEKQKKKMKKFEVTFLVFQSGSVIQSVIHEVFGKPYYYYFLEFILKYFEEIKENIQ